MNKIIKYDNDSLIGLKTLRENVNAYAVEVAKGKSFTVLKQSKPLFKIVPVDYGEDLWEEVVDFTKLRKGGIKIDELLSRLKQK